MTGVSKDGYCKLALGAQGNTRAWGGTRRPRGRLASSLLLQDDGNSPCDITPTSLGGGREPARLLTDLDRTPHTGPHGTSCLAFSRIYLTTGTCCRVLSVALGPPGPGCPEGGFLVRNKPGPQTAAHPFPSPCGTCGLRAGGFLPQPRSGRPWPRGPGLLHRCCPSRAVLVSPTGSQLQVPPALPV